MKLSFCVILFIFELILLMDVKAILPSLNLKPAVPITTPIVSMPNKILPKNVAFKEVLSPHYYVSKCPKAEGIIHQKMKAWFQEDYTLAPAIIRLHFHDCAVRGCDASILLNHKGSERKALASKTLRGFQVIDDIKSEIEKICPQTVSCADILTAAARDATILLGGPFWEVPYGRKDGKISIDKEAEMVPQGHENVTSLIQFFQKMDLNLLDLVVLSGSHTIGRSTCYSILRRLAKPDNDFDRKYWKNLTRSCKWSSDYVNLDVTTPRNFDVEYYKNLEKKLGLLSTDQELYSDPRTGPFVSALASQPELFLGQFSNSMVNLGNVIYPMASNQKEIRVNCNYINY